MREARSNEETKQGHTSQSGHEIARFDLALVLRVKVPERIVEGVLVLQAPPCQLKLLDAAEAHTQ